MTLRDLFSPCFFGHAPDPLIVVKGKLMFHECRRCQANLGRVLPSQKFKARKPAKPLRRVPAKVIHSEGRFQ